MRVIVVQGHNGLHRAITHILTSRNAFFNFFGNAYFCAVRGVRAVRRSKHLKNTGLLPKFRTALCGILVSPCAATTSGMFSFSPTTGVKVFTLMEA